MSNLLSSLLALSGTGMEHHSFPKLPWINTGEEGSEAAGREKQARLRAHGDREARGMFPRLALTWPQRSSPTPIKIHQNHWLKVSPEQLKGFPPNSTMMI